jgi:hypothetical protein
MIGETPVRVFYASIMRDSITLSQKPYRPI